MLPSRAFLLPFGGLVVKHFPAGHQLSQYNSEAGDRMGFSAGGHRACFIPTLIKRPSVRVAILHKVPAGRLYRTDHLSCLAVPNTGKYLMSTYLYVPMSHREKQDCGKRERERLLWQRVACWKSSPVTPHSPGCSGCARAPFQSPWLNRRADTSSGVAKCEK